MNSHVSHCYTNGQLTESMDGEMDAIEDSKMNYHLATCEDCAERMRDNVETANIVRRTLRGYLNRRTKSLYHGRPHPTNPISIP